MKPLRRSGLDHTFTCKLHHACLYLVRVHLMALPLTCDIVHLIAAYYSSIDPERMKGRVGLVGWSTVDGLTTLSGHPSTVGRAYIGQGKFAGQRPTFYHCTTQMCPMPPINAGPPTEQHFSEGIQHDLHGKVSVERSELIETEPMFGWPRASHLLNPALLIVDSQKVALPPAWFLTQMQKKTISLWGKGVCPVVRTA